MNSYRRGLRDGALVTLKLFLLEKFKLGQLGQTWSKLVFFFWYGSLHDPYVPPGDGHNEGTLDRDDGGEEPTPHQRGKEERSWEQRF